MSVRGAELETALQPLYSCDLARNLDGRTRGIPGYTGRQPKAPDAQQQLLMHAGSMGSSGAAAALTGAVAPPPQLAVPAEQNMDRGCEGAARQIGGAAGNAKDPHEAPGGGAAAADWWAPAAGQGGAASGAGVQLAAVGAQQQPRLSAQQWCEQPQARPGTAAAGSPARAQGQTTYGSAYSPSPARSLASGWQAAAPQLPWGQPGTPGTGGTGLQKRSGQGTSATHAGAGAAGAAAVAYAAADVRYAAYGGVRNSACNM